MNLFRTSVILSVLVDRGLGSGNSNRRVRKGCTVPGVISYAATNPPNRYMRMTYSDVIEPTGVGQIVTNTCNITVEVCYVYQDLGHDCHLGGLGNA